MTTTPHGTAGAITIDGKAFAAGLRERIGAAVPAFTAAVGRAPGLAVVLVGDDPASHVYVGAKQKACAQAGIASFEHRLPADVSQDDLIALVRDLNANTAIDGILVQLPLPYGLDERAVLAQIDPVKDVDGFHIENVGRLASGDRDNAHVPCTPLGCLLLLKHQIGDLSGKSAVVIGRSNIVGKPMAQLLLAESCTVTIAHSRTADLPSVVRSADIIVAAVGRAHMVQADWVKPGAVVIDVGINRLPPAQGASKGVLVGDVDFDNVAQVAAAITPVPGGVGPMTIACLLRNTLVGAHRIAGLPAPAGL
jgi:methylenetetrahydrofolate dehydrogenase (NADP+) / methenyltetrahydrofolate cyclohydrolase